MLGCTSLDKTLGLQCSPVGVRPTMLGYTCLYIMLSLQCYGSPVGCEAYNARIDLSRYNAMPTMLQLTNARIDLSRHNAMPTMLRLTCRV